MVQYLLPSYLPLESEMISLYNEYSSENWTTVIALLIASFCLFLIFIALSIPKKNGKLNKEIQELRMRIDEVDSKIEKVYKVVEDKY